MHKKKLKLNASKTEVLLTGTPSNLIHYCNFTEVNIDGSAVKVSEKVRSLGVIFDKNISMTQQITEAKRKAIGNLINISRISRFIDKSSKMKLVHGLVLSQIDFCNSLYCGLPGSSLRMLQLILNMSARLVAGMLRFSRDRITESFSRDRNVPSSL